MFCILLRVKWDTVLSYKDAPNKKRKRLKPTKTPKHQATPTSTLLLCPNDGGQTHVWWFGGLQANTAGNSHYDKVGQPKKRLRIPTAPCTPCAVLGRLSHPHIVQIYDIIEPHPQLQHHRTVGTEHHAIVIYILYIMYRYDITKCVWTIQRNNQAHVIGLIAWFTVLCAWWVRPSHMRSFDELYIVMERWP